MTAAIQDDLIARGLAPETQLVDMGYVEADMLVSSQHKGMDLRQSRYIQEIINSLVDSG